jgi:hypothetical protein
MWEIEFTDHFEGWWETLSSDERTAMSSIVGILEHRGSTLTRPYVDTVRGSRHANMRELRIQHAGHPFRLVYALEPRRETIILFRGDTSGNDRWYDEFVSIDDDLYGSL